MSNIETHVQNGSSAISIKQSASLGGRDEVLDVETLSAKQRDLVRFKLHLLKQIRDRGHDRISAAVYEEALSGIDGKRPDISTVRRWWKAWRNADYSVWALLPRQTGRPRRMALVPAVRAIVEKAILDLYLNRQRLPAARVYEALGKKLEESMDSAPPGEQLKAPSRATFYRVIQGLDPYRVVSARYGRREADRRFKHVQKGTVACYPLHIVEIDHTVADVILTLPDGTPLGRPYLTVAIDRYSRAVVGFHLSFDPPGWASVMRCLANVIRPKDGLLSKIGGTEFDWPCYGIPSILVVDNGPEFHSQSLIDAAEILGMEVRYCPGKEPNYKGVVERYFGTLNSLLFHNLPGTTRSSPRDNPDENPTKRAVITREELERLLTRTIVDQYMVRSHRMILEAPLDRWVDGVRETPARPYIGKTPLSAVLGAVEFRTLRREGINFKTLTYGSEELALARRRRMALLPKNRHRDKVKIKFDSSDMGRIWVYAVPNEAPVEVPCIDFDATDGIPLWQIREARRVQVERASNPKSRPKGSLYGATSHVQQEILDSGERSKRKGRTNKALGRVTNGEEPEFLPRPDDPSIPYGSTDDWDDLPSSEPDLDDQNWEIRSLSDNLED